MYKSKPVFRLMLAFFVFAGMNSLGTVNASAAGYVAGKNVYEPQGTTSRVGLVIAYTPGDIITIMDRDGNQFTFTLAANLKIVPADRAAMLAPGAYVTIIAPNNVPNGKQIAVGIVIHPGVPNGFAKASSTSTAVPTQAVATATETALPTIPSIETLTPTATAEGAATATATSAGSTSEIPAAGAASPGSSPQAQLASLLDVISSFLRQLLSL